MTANYNEGDTWTINGASTSVFFSNHEPLVTGGLITNDTTMATIEDGNIYLAKNRPDSNTNLLDNWYFLSPINQRAQTEYQNLSAQMWSIDRWVLWSGTLNLDNGCSLNDTGSVYITNLFQNLEERENYINKDVTVTLLAKDLVLDSTQSSLNNYGIGLIIGNGGSGTSFWDDVKSAKITQSINGIFLITLTGKMTNNRNYSGICIEIKGGSVQLIASKLEAGSRQTLAHKDTNGNWILNDAPPHREVELAKCMRYQISLNSLNRVQTVIGNGIKYSDKVAHIYVPLPCAMRNIPSAIYSGTFELSMISLDSTYYKYPVTNITVSGNNCSKRLVNIVVNTSQSIQSHDLNLLVDNDSTAALILDANF